MHALVGFETFNFGDDLNSEPLLYDLVLQVHGTFYSEWHDALTKTVWFCKPLRHSVDNMECDSINGYHPQSPVTCNRLAQRPTTILRCTRLSGHKQPIYTGQYAGYSAIRDASSTTNALVRESQDSSKRFTSPTSGTRAI